MAENKKSFILYADLIHTVKKMPKEKAGELFMTILSYVNDENPVVEDLVVDLVFEPVKQQLKRNLKEWDLSKKDRSESGRLGNLKKWNKDLYEDVVNGKITIEEAESVAKHRRATKTIAKGRTPTNSVANVAVNDNVTVNVIDNNVIINDCVKIPIDVFPSMPHASDLDDAPKTKIQSAIEMLKITCQVDVGEPEVITMWNIFKDQNLTGKRYYPDKDAVYAHFLNWIIKKDFKKQKNGNSNTFKPKGKDAGAEELIQRLRLKTV